MPRRRRAIKREVIPDAIYNSKLVTKFVNRLMLAGKKGVAETIFYGALDIIKKKMPGENPNEIFRKAIEAAKPILEVKSRRIGGANYQVPIEVRPERAQTLALRWIVNYTRQRKEKCMAEKLAGELMDLNNGNGATYKKKEDTHRMAEANKAFAHYKF
ncbi:30S ribosomal protein S7 [bacterium]|nr:30S ribosomal protein S7 [bacterium]